MAVDPVPYVVHGARHSADVFRQAHYDATGGAEGVSLPQNLSVRATGTPSGQVRVAPGGATILNSYSGGDGQSYSVRNASETLVDVPASDSTGSKSWRIIFRVSDPQFGGPIPVDAETGPYAFLECVANSATVDHPHIDLARVDVPASTATITADMITDLREVANPIVGTATYGRPRLAADDDPRQNYLTAFWDHGTDGKWFGELFPGGWGSPNIAEIKIPRRATHMAVRATWASVYQDSGLNGYGLYWVEYGDKWKGAGWGDGRNLEFVTQTQGWNTTGTAGVYSTNWILIDTKPIPAKLRGKTIQFAFKAGRSIGSDNNAVFMNSQSSMGLELTFSMAPVNEDTI